MPYLHIQPENHKHVKLFSDILDDLRDTFSVEDANGRFSTNRFASTRYYPITPTGLCPIGFVPHVLQHVLRTFTKTDIKIDPIAAKQIKPRLSQEFQVITPKTIASLREYQIQALESCIRNGRGIVEHPTSAGKTPLMASLILSCLSLTQGQIVILVPDPGLARQTYDSFVKFGITDIFKWDIDSEKDIKFPSNRVIITHQKLIIRRKQIVQDHLTNASVLIVDECHTLQRGNKINKIIDLFETPNRFGLTGTLPDTIDSQWNVFGKLGPVIAREEAHDLSEQGYIAAVQAIRICINYATTPTHINYKGKGQAALKALRQEVDWLIEQKYRSDIICKIAGGVTSNALILVDRIATGEQLVEQLREQYPNKRIELVNGSVEVEVREQIKKLIESSTNTICVAMMQIFRQGIDISNIHYLILAATGKAKARLIQSIGRGRRLHPDKIKLILFDIVDVVGYSIQHSYERLSILQEQQIPVTDKHFYESTSNSSSTNPSQGKE